MYPKADITVQSRPDNRATGMKPPRRWVYPAVFRASTTPPRLLCWDSARRNLLSLCTRGACTPAHGGHLILVAIADQEVPQRLLAEVGRASCEKAHPSLKNQTNLNLQSRATEHGQIRTATNAGSALHTLSAEDGIHLPVVEGCPAEETKTMDGRHSAILPSHRCSQHLGSGACCVMDRHLWFLV